MNSMFLVLLFVTLGGVAVAFLIAWDAARDARKAANDIEQAWMPEELRGATLAYSEPKAMRIFRPIAVVAKVDRAYRHANGEVTLVEFKTRGRHTVYRSDIIELSQQRLVVERSGRGKVRDVGYVVTELRQSGERQTHSVRLLNTPEAVRLAERYKEIVRGDLEPLKTQNKRLCRQCGFVANCRPELLLASQRRGEL